MRAAAFLLAVVACKPDEVPFKPPPPEDAKPPRDAASAPIVDAAVAEPAKPKPKATKIAVGDLMSCALMSDATLRCWGDNSFGQLGDGTKTNASTPVTPKLTGVKDIAVGTAHVCALLDDASVACWGRINVGDNADPLLVPTAIPGLTGVTRVYAVRSAACASLSAAQFVCWGDVDSNGQPRLSGGELAHRLPTPVRKVDDVVAVTANGALHTDGSLSFWRAGTQPIRLAASDVAEIASSGDELCVLSRGSVMCIGPTRHCVTQSKGKGQGVVEPSMETLRLPPAKHIAFDVGLCVVTQTGRLQCLQNANGCRVDDPWPGLANIATVSGFCALTTEGGMRCWSVDSASRQVSTIAGITKARALAASSTHACVLVHTGEIFCLGSNKSGALGRGEKTEDVHLDAKAVAL